MRSTIRLVTALLAALVMLGATLSTGTASATERSTEKARTYHVFKELSGGGKNGKFYVKGQVVTAKNKVVKLQKKACKRCGFKSFKQQRTTKAGRFNFKFGGKVGDCFRIYVPANATHKATNKWAGCIVRR
ncbi:hypothetical protein LRP67_05305 [Nocardioides sp. cx-169]|uniref:hypothetical protein n=1 Tax=Nocardioides sp. cx-169 TaxID=2899080 RepID=UPI001E2CE94C|nr:hypothetical protein [Nocardioides sp. cx-169]MCD4533495.1 hypothetical protein [Nocardioides sp. cx-169]